MHDWDPLSPLNWEKVFGLVALNYFGKNRTDAPNGMHLMMQDGKAASFAFHIGMQTAVDPLGWAWSSNVRHTVGFDPHTKTATVRRWDDTSYVHEYHISTSKQAQELVRDLEGAPRLQGGASVIDASLDAFCKIRKEIEHRGGTEREAVLAFNTTLLLAEQWRVDPENVPNITLAHAAERFVANHHRLNGQIGTRRVRDYPVGEVARYLVTVP